ncbi:MAG: zinc ribbon domain-containing protein [Nitrososphaeraceae archaeon]|nr:zinc ribbon domain-containing protein [Nitrososphaeraceae archaeon]
MSFFGVDTLGGLTEKLKQLIDDTQVQYESLIDSTQLYKQGKMNEKEYFASIGKYLIASSALNFLAIKVILELKSAFDKGSSIKSSTGGLFDPSAKGSSDFGIGGFVSGGGNIGPNPISGNSSNSRIEPDRIPVDTEFQGSKDRDPKKLKNCIVCGKSNPIKAKFCSKCGNSQ